MTDRRPHAPTRDIPLVPDGDPTRVLLIDGDQRWTVADVLASARDLQAALQALPGPVEHLINLAARRDRFLVGLVAGILGAQVSLMPSTRSRGAIEDLLVDHPGTVILHDGDEPLDSSFGLEGQQLTIPPLRPARMPAEAMPRIPGDQRIARVFTSGTTGKPKGHDKHWGRLVENAGAAARALAVDDADDSHSDSDAVHGLHLLGTVPSQHMYGFESLILAALCGGATLSVDQPFFPDDIATALGKLPSPRMLVTTPYHLHHLLASDGDRTSCEQVLCATAPLDAALAEQAEQALGCALKEIYGSTETGQVAVRRPTRQPHWRLMDGIRLERRPGGEVIASGGHIERPVPLADCIEPVDAGRFRLAGRLANQVNIAGKRSSIEHLNAALRAIEGVEDGLFFRPQATDCDGRRPERLAAIVRAPGLTSGAIRQALRERLDPVFLPRPLVLVEQMPVNATGKITRDALEAILTDGNAAEFSRRDAS